MNEASKIELPVDQALSVWFDLERALEGKNGYGGDVAEIYAYRLLPPGPHYPLSDMPEEDQAKIASANLTRLAQHFVELHEGVEIGIEVGRREFRSIDLAKESFPPFTHRVHVQVTRAAIVRTTIAKDLIATLGRVRDHGIDLPEPQLQEWTKATNAFVCALGGRWNVASEEWEL